LDTDIAGARATGLPSLLVLSGVATPGQLLRAPAEARPDYLGRDLRAVGVPHPPDDGLGPLRELCAAAWSGELPEGSYDKALDDLDLKVRLRE
jgi:hypothetical protein